MKPIENLQVGDYVLVNNGTLDNRMGVVQLISEGSFYGQFIASNGMRYFVSLDPQFRYQIRRKIILKGEK